LIGGAPATGGTGAGSSLLDMLPADNEVGTWVQTCGVSLIADQTALYSLVDGAAPKYLDRGWLNGVYTCYSRGAPTITVMISDMGTDANAQAIYNYSLPPALLAIPGLANAVVDMGLPSAYAAYAYSDRFYIELNISEKDAVALTAIESFMSDILNRINRSHPGVGPDAGGAGAGGAGGTGGAGGSDGGPSCRYLTVNPYGPASAFTFSVTLPDGSTQSCSMKFTTDGGSIVRYWPAPITNQISGRVTAVSDTELSVDTCEAGTGCSSNVYHFAVATPGLTLTVPIGRLVSVWWWLYNGGWSCGQMLVISDSTSGTVARVWLAGSDSVVNQAFPAPFSVARQELFCNPSPSMAQGCGGNDVPPDDYAFQFTPQSANPPLVLATGETGTLDLTVGSGVLQHLTVHNLRSYQTLACDDYWNWAWWAVGSADTNDGGTTGGGGAGGSGGGGASGGTGGAGGSDGGTGPVDTYAVCYTVADPSDFVEIIKTSGDGMCVRLLLESPQGAGTLGLTITPRGWDVWDSARWPSSAAPCTTEGTPSVATQAISGTGTVTVNGISYRAGFTMDVNAVLTYPPGDSGASVSEVLQAQALPGNFTCHALSQGAGGSGGTATGGAGGSATGGNGGATDGGADGSQPGCRTDKIEFTQQTGCANDGSVEFCLPAPDAAALAEVLAIDATIFCEWGSSGRVGCNTLTEQLCLLPANCLGNTAPMSNASWQTVCQLAALDVVAKIAPTFYE